MVVMGGAAVQKHLEVERLSDSLSLDKKATGALDADFYKAIFDLTQAIAGQADLDMLYQALASSLRRVVSFDSLGLFLHDPVEDELRLHLSSKAVDRRNTVAIPAEGDSIGASVWKKQKPLILPSLTGAVREDPIISEFFEQGIRSMTLVPLSNGDRRLGILGVAFHQPYQPDDCELRFFELVASEFAVAVDGYLSRRSLEQERERMHALFEITTAITSKLPMDELFRAISEQLSRVIKHDLASFRLLDRSTGKLRLIALHCPFGYEFETDDMVFNPEGLPSAEAIRTGKPVVTCGPDFQRFPSPLYEKYLQQFSRSLCVIPLTGRNDVLGVIHIIREATEPFTQDEVNLLLQVAREISLALENSLRSQDLLMRKDQLATETLCLDEEIRFDQNVSMVGESPAFQAVVKRIRIVAPTDATVLVQGETGTGKELVARAIHDLSGRSSQPFVKVNCAAIPATLLESELFGHEKGSFTGAFAQKIGRFELAHKGTLFLDEIGEIPLELQPKLLRAIQEQELERLGGNRTIHVDVRFVAATNRNLKQMMDEGKFRSDLFYRLHVFPLTVPSLRERREDIPLLIRYFTQTYAKRMNRIIEDIPSASLEALMAYDWPGNVRELQNIIERSVILSSDRTLEVPLSELAKPPARIAQVVRSVEHERILQALRESGGKVGGPSGAAFRLGLRRTTLQSRMKRLHIEREYRIRPGVDRKRV